MNCFARIFAALCVAFVFAACQAQDTDFSRRKTQEPLPGNLEGLMAQCRAASRVEIFEGLPHPMNESALLEQELRRGVVFQNHGFGFYSPALSVPQGERDRLVSEVMAAAAFMPYSGPKFCGGFHPDLLVRFHLGGGGKVDVQLCFGCNEAIFYGASESAKVDIEPTAEYSWQAFHRRHWKKRPAAR